MNPLERGAPGHGPGPLGSGAAGAGPCQGPGPDPDPGPEGTLDRGDTVQDAAAVEEAKLLMEQDVIKFCDKHKLNLLASSCIKCRLVSRSVGCTVLPELIRMMKAKAVSDSDIPSAVERYASCLDEKAPTLTFSESNLSLAVSLFGRGKMVPPLIFDELSREYLHLPPGQNNVLTK